MKTNDTYRSSAKSEITRQLQQELSEIKKLKSIIKANLCKAPKGKLEAHMARGKYPQYYILDEKDISKKEYLKKKSEKLIVELAQKEYDQKILKKIEQKERNLEVFLKNYPGKDLHTIYESLSDSKKRLANPYTISDEDFIAQWQDSFGNDVNTYPRLNGILTEKGELVRSKSEKMIADKLFYSNIPYVYEAPLYLENGSAIFPDFALLNVRKRETIYLEHFGMMDDCEYCKNAIEKLEKYAESGLFPGRGLIITMESSEKPLNMAYLEDVLNTFLT